MSHWKWSTNTFRTYTGKTNLWRTYRISQTMKRIFRTMTEHKTSHDEHQRVPLVPWPSGLSGQMRHGHNHYATWRPGQLRHLWRSDSLTTRPSWIRVAMSGGSQHDTLYQWWVYVGTASQTLAQHKPNIGWIYRIWWEWMGWHTPVLTLVLKQCLLLFPSQTI